MKSKLTECFGFIVHLSASVKKAKNIIEFIKLAAKTNVTNNFLATIMRILLEHDFYSRMSLLTPTTVIGCGPSLCLTRDITCKATGGTI